MSDIGLEFPLWVDVAFFGSLYWVVLVPAVLVLSGIGWFGRRLPKAARYAAWGAAGLCAAPFALLLVLAVGGLVAESERKAEAAARERTLGAAETINSLLVPAGAVLEYAESAHDKLLSIALPRPMRVAGIWLEQTVEPLKNREWSGTLAQDQVIGGWPCRAGRLWFTSEGVATRCELAAEHGLSGYDLPAGTDCWRNPDTGVWNFQLPPEGPALRIPALKAELPPGGTLTLASDGALRRLYVPHEAQTVIAGVALFDHLVVSGSELTGELAAPTLVGGETLAAEAVVRIDLTTGRVEATRRSLVMDP